MTILTFVWRGCAGCWEGEQWLHQQRPAGLAWAGGGRGPRTVRRTQRPGLRGQRERAAVSATSTVSQSGAAQSDRVSRSASPCHAPCHAPITQLSLCHAWASEIPPRPGEAEVRGHQWGQRTVPHTCEAATRSQFHVTPRAVNIWHPPRHSHSSVPKRERGLVLVRGSSVPGSLLAVTTHNR